MLKVYNTLSRKKQAFRPRKRKKVNLFVCGPTVYNYSHLGHARTYIAFDIIARYLKEKGFNLFYLQNITDIDDKIIKRAKERKTTPAKLTKFFEKEYFKDLKNLKIKSVTKYARATDHIKEIINQVEKLLKKGFAYRINNGIYYDISKFKRYGKLSKRTILQAEDSVSRIDQSKNKRNKGDFCLWKFSKPNEPKWQSPFGWGRPGWHIEDTAITEKYFGPQYDIHGGARDLIFPHHEAEIAQMEAVSGKKPLVKYWFHSGFLTVKEQKMAKSLGNFITIKDFLKKDPARLLRLLVIKSHYRSPLDYNDKLLSQTKKELEKIDEFIEKIKRLKPKSQTKPKIKILQLEKEFKRAMEDDFNTPKAISVIFKLINKGNSLADKKKLAKDEAKQILKFLKEVDKIFDFIFQKEKQEIPQEIKKTAERREKYRKEKQWQKADQLRKKIEKSGYGIKDTAQGPKVKKLLN